MTTNKSDTVGTTEYVASFLNGFPRLGFYRFEFKAKESVRLPGYPGSAWRGLLGHALKRTVCVTRQPTCAGCMLTGTCVYSVVFESPPKDPGDQTRYSAVAHPFALVVEAGEQQILEPGQEFAFGLNLFGAANSALPYLAHAMTLIGSRGIGKGHGRFSFTRLQQRETPADPWRTVFTPGGTLGGLATYAPGRSFDSDAPNSATVRLLTPLRIKRRGHLLGPAEFRFDEFVRQLVWRIDDLARWYGEPVESLDREHLLAQAEQVEASCGGLRWRDWTRYSSRQETSMKMGGLVGEIRMSGAGLQALWPLLEVGQWVGLGKATSMGLGCYQLDSAASLPAQTQHAAADTMAGVGSER